VSQPLRKDGEKAGVDEFPIFVDYLQRETERVSPVVDGVPLIAPQID
jgi:hypothetical protein